MQFETLEPAIFGEYNMCLVVSRSNLVVHSRAEIEKILTSNLGGRLLQALLDLDDQSPELRKRYAESEYFECVAEDGTVYRLKDWTDEEFNKAGMMSVCKDDDTLAEEIF